MNASIILFPVDGIFFHWASRVTRLISLHILRHSCTLSSSGMHDAPSGCFNTYLYFLFILESPLADNDVLNSPSVSKLLLKDGVVLEEI